MPHSRVRAHVGFAQGKAWEKQPGLPAEQKPFRNMKPSTTWNSETHWGPTAAASRTSRCSADVSFCPALTPQLES